MILSSISRLLLSLGLCPVEGGGFVAVVAIVPIEWRWRGLDMSRHEERLLVVRNVGMRRSLEASKSFEAFPPRTCR
jgi:hypothetical protein